MTLWDFDYCESLLCEAIVFKTRLAIVKDAKRKGKGGGGGGGWHKKKKTKTQKK